MSLKTLEREILAKAKIATNNPKLRMKDILEWSTGDVKPEEGEIVLRLDNPGVNICIKQELSKKEVA